MQNNKTLQSTDETRSHRVSGFGNSYLFTGRRFDDTTGLYYNRNRYYEPGNGRFLSRDPIAYLDGMR